MQKTNLGLKRGLFGSAMQLFRYFFNYKGNEEDELDRFQKRDSSRKKIKLLDPLTISPRDFAIMPMVSCIRKHNHAKESTSILELKKA